MELYGFSDSGYGELLTALSVLRRLAVRFSCAALHRFVIGFRKKGVRVRWPGIGCIESAKPRPLRITDKKRMLRLIQC